MIAFLKFVHFFAIAAGVGGGFAGLLMGLWARNASMEVKTWLGPMLAALARLGFVSLVLLWISGVALTFQLYGGFGEMGLMFHVKLILVTFLTFLSTGVQLVRAGALPAHLMANPARRMTVSKTASVLGLLILVVAALAFN